MLSRRRLHGCNRSLVDIDRLSLVGSVRIVLAINVAGTWLHVKRQRSQPDRLATPGCSGAEDCEDGMEEDDDNYDDDDKNVVVAK